MCITLIHKNDEIETVGQLRNLMNKIIYQGDYTPGPDGGCLCGIDLVSTCGANGFSIAFSKCFTWGDLRVIAESNAKDQRAALRRSDESTC
jgi:hypothetical protein